MLAWVKSTLMRIFIGLGPSNFCRKIETRRPTREEDGMEEVAIFRQSQ